MNALLISTRRFGGWLAAGLTLSGLGVEPKGAPTLEAQVPAPAVALAGRNARAVAARRQARRQIVMLRGGWGEGPSETVGAGIVVGVGPDRLYVATANHVVRQENEVATNLRARLEMLPNESLEVQVTDRWFSRDPDLAVVTVGLSPQLAFVVDSIPFPAGPAVEVEEEDPVRPLGNPNGEPWDSPHGAAPPVASADETSIRIQFSLDTGYSGGGLFTDDWLLVGMLVRDAGTKGEAIPIRRILQRLREWGVPVELGRTAESPPQATRFLAVSAGTDHACGLSLGRALYCWGSSDPERLGAVGAAAECVAESGARRACARTPTWVAGDSVFRAVAAGGAHSCALTEGQLVLCWGRNDRGQAGADTGAAIVTPVRAGSALFTAVSAGGSHTCAVTPAGGLSCWGDNRYGQLGVGAADSVRNPVPRDAVIPADTQFAAISSGADHSCALTAGGRAYCWGRNDRGQLGVGDTLPRLVPTPVAGDAAFDAVTAGGGHTCALGRDGQILCWGSNAAGQLGVRAQGLIQMEPVPVASDLRFESVAAGTASTCAITREARLYCWGSNAHGLLGTVVQDPVVRVPAPVGGEANAWFSAVSVGGRHICAVLLNRTVSCWGSNELGQLGLSEITLQEPRPQRVLSVRRNPIP